MAKSSARAQWARFVSGGGRAPGTTEPVPALRGAFSGTVLGVDPSLRGTGLAVVEFFRGEGRLVVSGTVRPGAKAPLAECLAAIHRAIASLAASHRLSVTAVEQTIFVQNFQTAQILGAARGAALAAAALAGLAVAEYPPLRVKQAVSGFGRASKQQVNGQVQALLGLPGPLPPDEADAAAVALCHALTSRVGPPA